jgi:hypothetical protein
LIETAKGKGYVLFDEIDELLPEDYTHGPKFDILSEFDRAGIEVLEGRDSRSTMKSGRLGR